MLESLTIKNFAIIENTSLSFDLGFNVLIGQTGAGKSIILDALKFVLGDKPSKDNIRHNTNEMSVKAVFSNINSKVVDKLKDFDIDCEEGLIIFNRTFNIEGKSSCKINGETVTVSMLKQIGEMIFDMYGQNDGVSVLNVKNHIKMIDLYKPEKLTKYKTQISDLLKQYKEVEKEISDIGGYGEDRERLLDLLAYQIKEIETANLQPNEDVDLEAQIKTLTNFEKISSALEQSYALIESDNLGQALSHLGNIKSFDDKLEDYHNRLNSSVIELEDIASSIKDYLSNMSYSEAELDALNTRLESIKLLKKKYGKTIEDVLSFLDKTKNQYDDILNSEEKLKVLNQKKTNLRNELYKVCLDLHNTRVVLSNEIEKKVEIELKELGMNNASFKVNFEPLDDVMECNFTPNGIDKVEFMFSANMGEEKKSLAKTISGGEMSRFMLAIKSVLNASDEAQLLIFDEIDSGVSGEIGYKVGQKLCKLSKDYQILCITHLPQVTVLADKHIFISKSVEAGATKSMASYLDEKQLLSYITSLFGSYESEAGLNHAKELLTLAQNYKASLNK